jgi:glutaminyl-peptide cyclotransferase
MVRWMSILFALSGIVGGCSPGKDAFDFNGNDVEVQAKNLPKPAAFDGERAMGHLKAICAIGPRMSGTQGMKKQQELLRKHFEELGLKVTMQSFDAKQRSKPNPIPMSNMIVSFAPDKKKRVILCSHYDTRPIADQEEDPRKWRETFVSANDGGSGLAMLMELARHLKDLKIEVGVDLVFFDGEEYIWNNRPTENGGDIYFLGSRHFASTWSKSDPRPDYRAAILLDMIGGINAQFPFEGHSRLWEEELCDEIWKLAKNLKCSAFRYENGGSVLDDHVALHEFGIPAIDIIDFSYKHWHKLSDTPENCSAASMEQVARVLSVWLQRVK